MKIEQVNHMGMLLDKITHESCTAMLGVVEDWATIYSIESKEQGAGHATELLLLAKEHYTKQNKTFGSSVALNKRMEDILKRLNIPEYK